jgi:WD40 repeat protein
MKNLIGSTINHYQILLKIRETGTRVLYRAFDTQHQKYVGVEFVKSIIINPDELYEMIKEQAKKNSCLEHPNIPKLIDSGITKDGVVFFVFDFAPFYILRRLFNLSFTWQQTCKELVTVCQIVAHAHQKGILHGFLTPGCIVLDEENVPYLFDFGFEQIITRYMFEKIPGSWINEWGYAYCSPEQLTGKNIDLRSDVYSVGLILHEWMTGEIVLLDETVLGTLFRRSKYTKRDLRLEINPRPIQIIIEKSISKQPENRYQTMQEVAILLARGALDLPISKKISQNPLLSSQKKYLKYFLPVLFFTLILLAFLSYTLFVPNTQNLIVEQKTIEASSPPTNIVLSQTPFVKQTDVVATAIPSIPTKTPTETPFVTAPSYPLHQGDKLTTSNTITIDNIDRIITLGLWGSGQINHFVMSPNGEIVAAASSVGIFLYDSETFEPIQYIDTRSSINVIEFSPDGRYIASGDVDGLIVLWDQSTGKDINSFSGHKVSLSRLVFSPNGKYIASVSIDNQTIQWEIASGNAQSIQANQITSLAYSSNGNYLITAGDDFKVNLWESEDLTLEKTFTMSGKITKIKSMRNSNTIVTASTDRRITLLDIDEQKINLSLTGVQYGLSDVAISPTGTLIVAGDVNGNIVAWDATGATAWKFVSNQHLEQSNSQILHNHTILFSPDGKIVYSSLKNGIIRVFDANTGEFLDEYGPVAGQTTKFEISSDGKLGIFQQADKTMLIREMATGNTIAKIVGEIKPGGAFSSENNLFAVLGDNSVVKVYNTKDWVEIYSFNGHQNVQTIKFVHNDRHLAVGNTSVIRLWSLSSGQELKVNKNYDLYGCTTLYDPSESPILHITGYSYIVENSKNNRTLCTIKPVNWMRSFQVNEKTSQISIGGNSKLEVINFSESQQTLVMQDVNRINITQTVINPSGTLLAVALDDYTIRVWNVSTQQEVMRLYGHKNTITNLKFSPDGSLLISSSMDGTIRLWGVP